MLHDPRAAGVARRRQAYMLFNRKGTFRSFEYILLSCEGRGAIEKRHQRIAVDFHWPSQ